jgi:DNA-binding transcriptional MerR regulator
MTDGDRKVGPPASNRGVYGISVAAELSGINEQSLRLYEREGLLTPARSPGGTRRYSADDLVRLQRIRELVDAGVNIAGIARILGLEDRNTALDDRNITLEGDNVALRAAARGKSARRPSGLRPGPGKEAAENKRSTQATAGPGGDAAAGR